MHGRNRGGCNGGSCEKEEKIAVHADCFFLPDQEIAGNHNKMGKAAPQDKEMENLMKTEVGQLDPAWLERVDDCANRVKGSAHNQKDESLNGDILIDGRHEEDGEPAHQNIEAGIEPAGRIQKEDPEENTRNCQAPHHSQKNQPHGARKS